MTDADETKTTESPPGTPRNEPIPAPGTVILCHVPNRLEPDVPGIARVPCLVLDSMEGEDGEPPLVLLSPGKRIDRAGDRKKEWQIDVEHADELVAIGLHKPTRFDLSMRVEAEWTPEWCPTSDRGSAILGTPPERLLSAARHACAAAERKWNGLESLDAMRHPLPNPGDSVLVRLALRPGDEPKPTACLVLGIRERDGKPPEALLVPSLPNDPARPLHPNDVVVDEPAHFEEMGLRGPRRFFVGWPRRVDWSDDILVVGNERGTHMLGRLPKALETEIFAAYGRASSVARALEIDAEGKEALVPSLPNLSDAMPPPPKPGDVINAFAPYDGALNRPGPKARPCFVLESRSVEDPRTGATRTRLLVAIGTTQDNPDERRTRLPIDDPESLAELRLDRPGAIRFGALRTFEWTHAYASWTRGDPLLGPIPERHRRAAHAMAAEALSSVQSERRPDETGAATPSSFRQKGRSDRDARA
jgi:hypothetical protein